MLSFTRHELDLITVGTAVTVIAFVFVAACIAWRQQRDLQNLRADLDALWAWARADPDPLPLADEPDTVIAHPTDTWSRQQALLHRYAHTGQHRT